LNVSPTKLVCNIWEDGLARPSRLFYWQLIINSVEVAMLDSVCGQLLFSLIRNFDN
jgi:hypothetical protein